jgi:hypothetical protein
VLNVCESFHRLFVIRRAPPPEYLTRPIDPMKVATLVSTVETNPYKISQQESGVSKKQLLPGGVLAK